MSGPELWRLVHATDRSRGTARVVHECPTFCWIAEISLAFTFLHDVRGKWIVFLFFLVQDSQLGVGVFFHQLDLTQWTRPYSPLRVCSIKKLIKWIPHSNPLCCFKLQATLNII